MISVQSTTARGHFLAVPKPTQGGLTTSHIALIAVIIVLDHHVGLHRVREQHATEQTTTGTERHRAAGTHPTALTAWRLAVATAAIAAAVRSTAVACKQGPRKSMERGTGDGKREKPEERRVRQRSTRSARKYPFRSTVPG